MNEILRLVLVLLPMASIAAASIPSYLRIAAASSDHDSLLLAINFERIRTQLAMTENSHAAHNTTMAFGHAYAIHTSSFPAIDPILKEMNKDSYRILEIRLANLAFHIKAEHLSTEDVRSEVAKIETLIESFAQQIDQKYYSDKKFVSHQVILLLNDSAQYYQEHMYYFARFPNCTYQEAFQMYQLSNAQTSQLTFESAIGFAEAAHDMYLKIADQVQPRRHQEITSFFAGLKSSMEARQNSEQVFSYVAAIERDLTEEVFASVQPTDVSRHALYFSTIRDLLNKTLFEVNRGNYDLADQHTVTAYLDNYEYLEAPIEKHNPELMVAIEIAMREELRKMIADRSTPDIIDGHIKKIIVKLDQAEVLLASDPSRVEESASEAPAGFADVKELAAGFGSYQGQQRGIGDAEESQKSGVRNDVDTIRQDLDTVQELYSVGDTEEAFLLAQSAYLDSYENIEVPLRPIDPNFTLEMEIRFAELRNLIQTYAPYSEVEDKIIEIRRGLDESERLVSGTGIVAPAISFLSSLSIMLREGLEGSIIIGTIIAYLESTRNHRFKKHVYYGIILAIAGTVVAWIGVDYITQLAGISGTIVKAVASISAVGVLFWVSFWILDRIEGKRWAEFMRAKLWKATYAGSGIVFSVLSFFTVYREGFGTALFFQAMFSLAKYMELYVVLGLLAGAAVVIGVVFVITRIGKRMPMWVLFSITIAVGAYMSITFIGNAVREFQVANYIPTTPLIGVVPRFDISLATMTGIHPTLETLLAQLALLAAYVTGSVYLLLIRPRRESLLYSSRKPSARLS